MRIIFSKHSNKFLRLNWANDISTYKVPSTILVHSIQCLCRQKQSAGIPELGMAKIPSFFKYIATQEQGVVTQRTQLASYTRRTGYEKRKYPIFGTIKPHLGFECKDGHREIVERISCYFHGTSPCLKVETTKKWRSNAPNLPLQRMSGGVISIPNNNKKKMTASRFEGDTEGRIIENANIQLPNYCPIFNLFCCRQTWP